MAAKKPIQWGMVLFSKNILTLLDLIVTINLMDHLISRIYIIDAR